MLSEIVTAGLAAGGLGLVIRIVAKHWAPALYKRRPLSCPVCTAWWCALLVTGAQFGWNLRCGAMSLPSASAHALLSLFGAVAIASFFNVMVLPGYADIDLS